MKKHKFKRQFAKRVFTRFHMSPILLGTILSGVIFSKIPLIAGLDHMVGFCNNAVHCNCQWRGVNVNLSSSNQNHRGIPLLPDKLGSTSKTQLYIIGALVTGFSWKDKVHILVRHWQEK